MSEGKTRGIVYLFTNLYMPDVVKIGRCDSDDIQALKTRVLSLYSTGVPVHFDIKHAIRVDDPVRVEKELHEAYKDIRVNPRREFFKMDPETEEEQGTLRQIMRIMNLIGTPIEKNEFQASIDVSAEISEDEEEAHSRAERESQIRAPFNFEMVNIPEGEELEFYDEPGITAIVVDGKKINFEGADMFLSSAAKIVLRRRGMKWESVRGPSFWRYKGEILVDRRGRLESKADS